MSEPFLNIVTALPCEARFFIDQYRLTQSNNSSAYPIYSNAQFGIYLIVSGIGKIRSAAATSYLQAFVKGGSQSCFLNVGIAGALAHTVGDCFVAHKVIDVATQKAFYPLPILKNRLPSQIILTVDHPEENYPNQGLVEMEAAGFYQAALNLVTHEQIQILKIISDNNQNPAKNVKSQQVIEIFRQNRPSIEAAIEFLLELSRREAALLFASHYFHEIIKQFHFTTYQQHQLKELLRKWQILDRPDHPLSVCPTAANSAGVLNQLETFIQNNPYAINLL